MESKSTTSRRAARFVSLGVMICIIAICTLIVVPEVIIALSPPPSEQIFEGYYLTSFEISSFVPLNQGCPGGGAGFWLTSTQDSGFYQQLVSINGINEGPQMPPKYVYLRFVGRLSSPRNPFNPLSGYGHLQLYDREVKVLQVLDMYLAVCS